MIFSSPAVRVFASRLPTGPTDLVGVARLVPAPVSAALTDTLSRIGRCMCLNHRSALGAGVFVLLIGFRDRAFACLVAAAPLLRLARGVAALVLRRIPFGVRASAFTLIVGAFVGRCHKCLHCHEAKTPGNLMRSLEPRF